MEKEIERHLLESEFRIIGYRQVLREVHNKNVISIIIAKNIDRDFLGNIVSAVEAFQEQSNSKIKLMFAPSKEWLGQVLQIDVPCGVAATVMQIKQKNKK